MAEFIKPPPLDIKCTSTDCENDLHCFKQLKRMEPDQRGKCRACGADLIDWSNSTAATGRMQHTPSRRFSMS